FCWVSDVFVSPSKSRELESHQVETGDVIATKMGLPPCIACVYPPGLGTGIITADVIRLRPNTEAATSEWLAAYINSEIVRRQVRGITGGVTRPKVTLRDFRSLVVALPPLGEQHLIIEAVERHD